MSGWTMMIALAATLFGGTSSSVRVEREAAVMGMRLHVTVEAETEPAGTVVVDRILLAVEELERSTSTRSPDSDLSRLNRVPRGEPIAVSSLLFESLAEAWSWSATTDGAFDPMIGALIDAWAEAKPDRPSGSRLRSARRSSGRDCFELRPATRRFVRHCDDAWIDSRPFEKGQVLAVAARVLAGEDIASARIEFGTQRLMIGPSADVAIPDPRDPNRTAATWTGVAGSVATASQFRPGFSPGDGGVPAVIDPGTGDLVDAWGSVTVRSADPVAADVLSTALFVMGPRRGGRWLAARPHIEAVFLVDTASGLVACGSITALGTLVPNPGSLTVAAGALSSDVIACPKLLASDSGPGDVPKDR